VTFHVGDYWLGGALRIQHHAVPDFVGELTTRACACNSARHSLPNG
jgi:hypothetical protein